MSLKIYENRIKVGAEKPFKILQLSDIHLNFADERDPPGIRELAVKRRQTYPGGFEALNEAGLIARENGCPLVSTGDLCDFISERNLEEVKKFTFSHGGLYAPGNHDYRLMGGMEYDVPYVRRQSFSRVQAVYPNFLGHFSRVIGGVKFIALDDAYYRFEKSQLEYLKKEAREGLPVVLVMHVPLYEEGLYLKTSRYFTRHASLVCVPPEKMYFYRPERVLQQTHDRVTGETFEYILSEPMIKCVLTGHSHKDHEAELAGGLIQLTTGLNTARMIEFY